MFVTPGLEAWAGPRQGQGQVFSTKTKTHTWPCPCVPLALHHQAGPLPRPLALAPSARTGQCVAWPRGLNGALCGPQALGPSLKTLRVASAFLLLKQF